MRAITEEIYNIPSERVIGGSNALRYLETSTAGRLLTPPSRTSSTTGRSSRLESGSRIGRRPILAGGNSNGDVPMLQYAGGKDRPGLRLLVLHDDP